MIQKTNKNNTQTKKTFKRLTRFQKALLLLAAALLIFSSFPIVLVLFIGLLPTITVMVTDKNNYDKQMIVGCFNIAGVFFYLFNILNNFSVNHAVSIASDIFNLIFMLLSAGIGLILYNEAPFFYASYIKNLRKRQIERIDERLKKLADEWGSELNNKHIS